MTATAPRAGRPGGVPMVRSSLPVLLLVLLLGPAGCSYDSEEPGLLGSGPTREPAPTRTAARIPPPAFPTPSRRAVDDAVPVAGEEVWTSADGLAVTVRIAVHAVRRMPGGTVLDWSVTPISAPGLTSPAVPAAFDLGLMSGGRPAITLVDGRAGRVHRPLLAGEPARCLCSPIAPGSAAWRIGVTRLMQIVFPPLPMDLDLIDVDIATVPQFSAVPVTPDGLVPQTDTRTDLARPAFGLPPYLAGPGFGYPDPDGQRIAVEPYRVVAGTFATSLVWRVQALSAGPGLDRAAARPLVAVDPRITGNRVSASGPVLVAGERRLPARLISDRAAGPDATACACTDLRSGLEGLRHADQVATLVTTYPPLREGVREIIVDFPGLGERLVDVQRRPELRGSSRLPLRGSRPAPWRSDTGEPPEWTLADWPTPLPDRGLVRAAVATVDSVLR